MPGGWVVAPARAQAAVQSGGPTGPHLQAQTITASRPARREFSGYALPARQHRNLSQGRSKPPMPTQSFSFS